MHIRRLTVIIFLAAFFTVFILLTEFCRPKSRAEPVAMAGNNEFVGDAQCQSCHPTEFSEWKTSDHFKAMMPASDTTVLGDFNNRSLTADGIRSSFFKKNGKYIINTQGPDGRNHDYEVLYTFGHYPLQQYLVAFPGGRMQATRMSWDSRQKKWFHQYAGQKIHSSDWLHWTRGGQNWNTMCASCHSTNLQKDYHPDTDSFHTTYSIINVSCESCHGAGKEHIDFIRSAEYQKGEKVAGSYLTSTKEQIAQINTCAPCHSVKADISAQLISSGELLDNYIPESPAAERFYPDGQVKEEAYAYTSFLQSKMFHYGIKCSNCHNPHTAKVLFSSNQLCLQCHTPKYDEPSHHFHAVNTEGAQCKSCHMPAGTFMGNDIRHDHAFRVPRPDLSVRYGTPNACNNCHADKSAQWAANAVVKWYGPDRKYHFAEDLVPGSRLDDQSEGHLVKLLGDTAVPPIVKTAALFYLGSISTPGSMNALRQALQAEDAQVRYQALRSLANFPAAQWQEAAVSLLADKVRAVRIAAADLFLTIPQEQLPENYRSAFVRARGELEQYLRYQADFPTGNVMMADHYLRLNDYENASKFYLRGLAMDSLMNYARLNLSTVYNSMGKNDLALQTLQTAAAIDPRNDRIFYNLGLLYNELKNTGEATKNFEKAVRLKSSNPRLYYNYGLLLFQAGKTAEAEQVLLKGLAVSPGEPDLNYAMAFLYIKTGQTGKARKYASVLKSIDPANPAYQAIFQAVGI